MSEPLFSVDSTLDVIRQRIPDVSFGMTERDHVFEVWAKTGVTTLGFASGATLAEAFENLDALLVSHE